MVPRVSHHERIPSFSCSRVRDPRQRRLCFSRSAHGRSFALSKPSPSTEAAAVVFSFALKSSAWVRSVSRADALCEQRSIFVLHVNQEWAGPGAFNQSALRTMHRRILLNPERQTVRRYTLSVLKSHVSNFALADGRVEFSHFVLMAENVWLVRPRPEEYVRARGYSYTVGFRQASRQCIGLESAACNHACMSKQVGAKAGWQLPAQPRSPRMSHEGAFAPRALFRAFVNERRLSAGSASRLQTPAHKQSCSCEETFLVNWLHRHNLRTCSHPLVMRIYLNTTDLCALAAAVEHVAPVASGVYGWKAVTSTAASVEARLQSCQSG